MSALTSLFSKPQKVKEEIDASLKTYFDERKLEIDKELEIYYLKEQLKFEIKATNQLGIAEHDFHQAKETKGIQLAKLDAEISIKESLLKEKDKTIEMLKGFIDSVVGKAAK